MRQKTLKPNTRKILENALIQLEKIDIDIQNKIFTIIYRNIIFFKGSKNSMKRPKIFLKNTRGISLITLAVTLVIMLLIVGTVTFRLIDVNKSNKLENMFQDISLMNDKVNVYYWKNGKLPVIGKYSQFSIPADALNPNDYGDYYVLDISALENLSNIDPNNTYIINEGSHTIYVADGVESEGVKYYTEPETYTQVFGQIVATHKVKTDGTKSTIELHVEELIDGIKEIVFEGKNDTRKYEADTKKVDETYEVTQNGTYSFTIYSNAEQVEPKTITVKVRYGTTYMEQP